jgi:hypothetical protein
LPIFASFETELPAEKWKRRQRRQEDMSFPGLRRQRHSPVLRVLRVSFDSGDVFFHSKLAKL